MPVYKVKTDQLITFTDATGISFVKNPRTGFHLNGDGNISIPHLPAFDENGATGGRMEVTVRPDSLTGVNQYIVDDQNGVFRIFHNGTNNRWRAKDFNSLNIDRTDFQDALTHVHALTWSTGLDGDYLIDGVISGTTSQASSVAGAPLIFGDNISLLAGLFGFIYGIKFYDAAVGGNLIAHYPVDEGTGTVITDVIGGNNGTLTMGTGTWTETADETATGVSFNALTISPTKELWHNLTWAVDPAIGDFSFLKYDGSGNLIDENQSNLIGNGTIVLTGAVWTESPPGTFTHDATTSGGGIRLNSNDGVLINGRKYSVSFTKLLAGNASVNFGSSTSINVPGAGAVSVTDTYTSPTDNLQIFSAIANEVISNIVIKELFVALPAQTIALNNCKNITPFGTYRFGSIYSATKDILTTWLTEKQATGVNTLWIKNGTVDVNIGWGVTPEDASITQQTVLAGESVLINVTGSYIGWQGTIGTVTIEQSVSR